MTRLPCPGPRLTKQQYQRRTIRLWLICAGVSAIGAIAGNLLVTGIPVWVLTVYTIGNRNRDFKTRETTE